MDRPLVLSAAALLPLLVAVQEDQERGVALVVPDDGLTQNYARRHALVVGIDDYADPGYPDLGYAVADARAVAEMLVDRFGFAEGDVRLILNEDATKAGMDEALEEWACDRDRIGTEDLLVVFFAGHGETRDLGGRGQRGYLVPSDAARDRDGRPSWSTLVGMKDIEDVSEAVPSKHALFLLDCCFGGLAVSRSAPPVAAGLSNRARQVITAGNAEQPVLDSGGGRHSVFTGSLLAGLNGDADVDADGVVTFGELFNHVGREVERKTETRQTPLQATLPDHEGGSVALFPPNVRPGSMSATERLKAMERTAEEQLAEVRRLSDALIINELVQEAETLWPIEPALVSDLRAWLARARDLASRRHQHEDSVRRVRQEAYLSQVISGDVAEGEGTEPDWTRVEPELRWRFQTFATLVEDLAELELLIADVAQRVELASTLRRRSIDDFQSKWSNACEAVAEHPLYSYSGLDLEPQVGLVPLGFDRRSGLWEFGHVLTGAIPERAPHTGELLLTAESCLVLVLVPGGEYVMGARASDAPWAESDEHQKEAPAPVVTLDPFFISKYEMTQGQWTRVVGGNPSYFALGKGITYLDAATMEEIEVPGSPKASLLHPVEDINWTISESTLFRIGLLLPTEAQWEYAARAETETPWWTGQKIDALRGLENLNDHYLEEKGEVLGGISRDAPVDGFPYHAPVGSLGANPMGLFDVHGNVAEWCKDWYGDYGTPTRLGDGLRLVEGSRDRVFRGGGYFDTAATARSANRHYSAPDEAYPGVGVRPVRAITGTSSDSPPEPKGR